MAAKKRASSSSAATLGMPWAPDSPTMQTPDAGTELPGLTERGEKLARGPGSQRTRGLGIR